jgi:hypothetical protein
MIDPATQGFPVDVSTCGRVVHFDDRGNYTFDVPMKAETYSFEFQSVRMGLGNAGVSRGVHHAYQTLP